MTVLLDSHTFIWWMSALGRLSPSAREAIEDNDAFVSAVTAYELGIKFVSGRLPSFQALEGRFEMLCAEQNFNLLAVEVPHALAAAKLPLAHRDPFDRLLAAQSLVDDLAIVTIDPAFKLFGCKTIW